MIQYSERLISTLPSPTKAESEQIEDAMRAAVGAMYEQMGRQLLYGFATGLAPDQQRVTLAVTPQLEPPTIDAEYEVIKA